MYGVTTQRGMPLRGSRCFCFRRVDITQCDVARDVLVLCHVRKLGPREGFGQSSLRENKTVVLRVAIYDTFAKALCSTKPIPTPDIQSRFQ